MKHDSWLNGLMNLRRGLFPKTPIDLASLLPQMLADVDGSLAEAAYAFDHLHADGVDPSHITYGSDFPYAPSAVSNMFTKELEGYRYADHPSIDRGNAAQLFPRLA